MKKLNVLGQLFTIVLLVLLAGGCSSDESSSDKDASLDSGAVNYADKVHFLDLSGAQGLYITGETSNSGSASALRSQAYSADSIQKAASAVDLEPNSIYKITADGRLERVAIEDENGDELSRGSVKPALIRDLNSLYLIMWLETNSDAEHQSAIPFLIHKGTGFAYNASEIIYSATKNSDGIYESFHDNIQWDENNNFYVQRPKINSDDINFEAIYKIDTSTLGSGSLTVTEIPSAYSFHNSSWMVDPKGAFIVFGGGMDSLEAIDAPVRYLSITTGAIHNINEDIPLTFEPNWILGLDDKVYTYVTDNCLDPQMNECTTWYSIEADNNDLPLITEVAKSNDQPMHWALHPETRFVIGGKLVYITGENTSFGIEEIDPITGSIIHHFDNFSTVFAFDGVKKYVLSNSDIYIFGTLSNTAANGFYKYNVATHTGTTIAVESGYDVQSFTVLADGRFLVEGIRLNDQAYFYGEVGTDGSVTVLSTVAIGAPTVLTMEAIQPADFMMIDGSAADWSIDLRVLSDASGDGSAADGDLLYYSQTTTDTQYFGMIEHGTDLNRSYYVRVEFESGEMLQFEDDNVTLPSGTLTEAGGIFARGSVIEFSMPKATVTTPNVVAVELFGITATGEINTSMSIDKMSN